jgi:hypothetical protein
MAANPEEDTMNCHRSRLAASLIQSGAIAVALTLIHYHAAQPLADGMFILIREGDPSDVADRVARAQAEAQNRVAPAHLRRAVPVAFAVTMLVAVVGGVWVVKGRRRPLLWGAVGGVAGAIGFAAAAPFVPFTGPMAGPDFTGRTVPASDIGQNLGTGGLLGVVVGTLVAVGWLSLVWACSRMRRNPRGE